MAAPIQMDIKVEEEDILCQDYQQNVINSGNIQCEKTFETNQQGTNDDYDDNEVHKCTLCEKLFQSEQLFKAHIKEHGKLNGLLSDSGGDTDSQSIPSKKSVHLRTNAKEPAYNCLHCPKTFGKKLPFQRAVVMAENQDKKFIMELIDCYRSLTALWDVKSQDYSNKLLKDQQKQQLLEKYKERYPNADTKEVLKKMNSLRAGFKRELKRLTEMDESGAGVDDDFESNLYYFDAMSFIKDVEITSTSRSTFQRHLESHKNGHPYKCEICSESFPFSSHLELHMRTHIGERPFKCDQCSKTFKQKGQLTIHKRAHKGQCPFTCEICSESFPSRYNLKAHMRSHMGEKPYKCSVCPKAFPSEGSRINHQRKHTNTFQCEICKKNYSNQGYLKIHLRIHTGERPYKCSYCPKAFLTSYQHSAHTRTHTAKRFLKCELCTKTFADNHSRNMHMSSHSNERRFKCNECPAAFKKSSHLTRHMYGHNGDHPYQCEICSKKCLDFCAYKIHMRVHTGERPYTCDLCSKTFICISNVKLHERKHAARPFKCDQCPKLFPTKEECENHALKHLPRP